MKSHYSIAWSFADIKFVVLRFTKLLSAFPMVQLTLMKLKKKNVKMLIQNSVPAWWICKQIKRDTKQIPINLWRHEVWSLFFHFQSLRWTGTNSRKATMSISLCLPPQLWLSTLTGIKVLPFQLIPLWNRFTVQAGKQEVTEIVLLCQNGLKTLIRTHTLNRNF